MAVYIELDELAANALIAVQKSGRRFVSYRAMEEYGLCVADILREKGIRMILSLSRDRTERVLQDKSELFKEEIVGGERGISLREGKSRDGLIDKYTGYLPVDILLAFRDEQAVSKLDVPMENR